MENVIRERFSLSLICTVRLFIFLYFKSVLNCVASRADLCCVRCYTPSANLRLRSAVVLNAGIKTRRNHQLFSLCAKSVIVRQTVIHQFAVIFIVLKLPPYIQRRDKAGLA